MYKCLLGLLILTTRVGLAGDTNLERATMRGLKAINVVVDPLDPQLERDGVTASALRARIEDRLRQGGVALDSKANEFLGLRVTSVRAKRMPVALCLSIALYQPVLLVRDNKTRTATGTWHVETVMMSGEKVLPPSTNSSLDELVDQFIRAWRSVQ